MSENFVQWEKRMRLHDESRVIFTELNESGAVVRAWTHGEQWEEDSLMVQTPFKFQRYDPVIKRSPQGDLTAYVKETSDGEFVEYDAFKKALVLLPQWKPIADCPKDGTNFLGGAMSGGELFARTVFYKLTVGGFVTYICPLTESVVTHLTHYMELPNIQLG